MRRELGVDDCLSPVHPETRHGKPACQNPKSLHQTIKLFKKWREEFSLMTGYNIDPAERVFTALQPTNVTVSNGKKRSVELQQVMRVMSRSLQFFHELTGDVGPPVQFMLKLAVVNFGSLLYWLRRDPRET